jgi:hypothetical protein
MEVVFYICRTTVVVHTPGKRNRPEVMVEGGRSKRAFAISVFVFKNRSGYERIRRRARSEAICSGQISGSASDRAVLR